MVRFRGTTTGEVWWGSQGGDIRGMDRTGKVGYGYAGNLQGVVYELKRRVA